MLGICFQVNVKKLQLPCWYLKTARNHAKTHSICLNSGLSFSQIIPRSARCFFPRTLHSSFTELQIKKKQTMADLLKSWVQTVVPQPCYDEFFIEYNFLHGMLQIDIIFIVIVIKTAVIFMCFVSDIEIGILHYTD